jgi:excisionase family DNA binding protein
MITMLEVLIVKARYMSPQETAMQLNVHPKTLRKWAKARKISAVRIGDKLSFDPAAAQDQ